MQQDRRLINGTCQGGICMALCYKSCEWIKTKEESLAGLLFQMRLFHREMICMGATEA